MKILSGNAQAVSRTLTVIDAWDNRIRQLKIDALRAGADCPACRGEYSWLAGERTSHSAILCGRNAVQLSPAQRANLSLADLASKLEAVGRVTQNRYLVRLAVDDYQLTIFPDGRAIISGTDDIAQARTLYAKYVGA